MSDKIEVPKALLDDIIHQLETLKGLKAFDGLGDGVKYLAPDNVLPKHYTMVPTDDTIELDYRELINKIEKYLR